MVFIGVFLIVSVASAAFVASELRRAPQGYEDETGFHEIRPVQFPTTRSRETEAQARWAA